MFIRFNGIKTAAEDTIREPKKIKLCQEEATIISAAVQDAATAIKATRDLKMRTPENRTITNMRKEANLPRRKRKNLISPATVIRALKVNVSKSGNLSV